MTKSDEDKRDEDNKDKTVYIDVNVEETRNKEHYFWRVITWHGCIELDGVNAV